MTVKTAPQRDVAALLQKLDELLAEARALRERVVDAMMSRRERPFWPDRRQRLQSYEPERRRR